MSEMKTLKFPGDAEPREIVDAKAREDISKLSEEIATETDSKISAHNTGTDTHSDIRLLIQGLTDRLNALADSDDTTLDQLSEVVAYIKSNRGLIESITTSKVSVADIVDNLTTNVANKPLSAAQGVALKALIDAISIPTTLPNPNALTFTGAVTGSYDGSAPLTVNIPSGSGGGGSGDAYTLSPVLVATVEGDGASTLIEQTADLSENGLYAVSVRLNANLATDGTTNNIWFRVGARDIYMFAFSFSQDANSGNSLIRRAGVIFTIVDGKAYTIGSTAYGISNLSNFCESGSKVPANKIMLHSANNIAIPEGITMYLWRFK